LPIVLEVVDTHEKIERIKIQLAGILEKGLITEQDVKMTLITGNSNQE
jgi:PII-like signaling protein